MLSLNILREVENQEKKDAGEEKGNVKEAMNKAELISFAFEIGYTISVPIIILVLGGRLLDKAFATAPLFMIIGLLISVFSTGYIIYKKTKRLM